LGFLLNGVVCGWHCLFFWCLGFLLLVGGFVGCLGVVDFVGGWGVLFCVGFSLWCVRGCFFFFWFFSRVAPPFLYLAVSWWVWCVVWWAWGAGGGALLFHFLFWAGGSVTPLPLSPSPPSSHLNIPYTPFLSPLLRSPSLFSHFTPVPPTALPLPPHLPPNLPPSPPFVSTLNSPFYKRSPFLRPAPHLSSPTSLPPPLRTHYFPPSHPCPSFHLFTSFSSSSTRLTPPLLSGHTPPSSILLSPSLHSPPLP